MKETIIIDCSSRLWLAGAAGPRGGFVVAPVEVDGLRSPYLWAEILLDRNFYENPDEDFLAHLVEAFGQGDDHAREVGWYLGGGMHPERVVTLKNPLRVLSEPYAIAGDAVMVRQAGVKLLMFLLRPLLTALRKLGIAPEKRSAVVITPAFLGRAGMLCLLAALRRLGVRRARLLPRSLAISLYGAFVLGAEESLSVDSQEEGLTLRRIKGRITESSAALTVVRSHTLSETGWPDILESLRVEGPQWNPRSLRRVLFGIGLAPISPGLSWDSLEAFLCGEGGELLRQRLKARLVPAVKELGWPEAGLVVSGLCFMAPGVERMARVMLDAGEPFDDSLAIERPSRGVAAMTGWLGGKSGRRVELSRADGVFIEVGGRIHQVLPADVLASLDSRERSFRRLAQVSVPEGLDREVLGVHIIQGVGDTRQDGVSVGLGTQELGLEGEAFESLLAVTLMISSSGTPARARGTARVHLEEMEEEFKLHFVNSGVVFT